MEEIETLALTDITTKLYAIGNSTADSIQALLLIY